MAATASRLRQSCAQIKRESTSLELLGPSAHGKASDLRRDVARLSQLEMLAVRELGILQVEALCQQPQPRQETADGAVAGLLPDVATHPSKRAPEKPLPVATWAVPLHLDRTERSSVLASSSLPSCRLTGCCPYPLGLAASSTSGPAASSALPGDPARAFQNVQRPQAPALPQLGSSSSCKHCGVESVRSTVPLAPLETLAPCVGDTDGIAVLAQEAVGQRALLEELRLRVSQLEAHRHRTDQMLHGNFKSSYYRLVEAYEQVEDSTAQSMPHSTEGRSADFAEAPEQRELRLEVLVIRGDLERLSESLGAEVAELRRELGRCRVSGANVERGAREADGLPNGREQLAESSRGAVAAARASSSATQREAGPAAASSAVGASPAPEPGQALDAFHMELAVLRANSGQLSDAVAELREQLDRMTSTMSERVSALQEDLGSVCNELWPESNACEALETAAIPTTDVGDPEGSRGLPVQALEAWPFEALQGRALGIHGELRCLARVLHTQASALRANLGGIANPSAGWTDGTSCLSVVQGLGGEKP